MSISASKLLKSPQVLLITWYDLSKLNALKMSKFPLVQLLKPLLIGRVRAIGRVECSCLVYLLPNTSTNLC